MASTSIREAPASTEALRAPTTQFMGKMLIGGDLVDAEAGGVIESVNPATEEYLGQVPRATAADVQRAVEGAEKAQRSWAALSVGERASRLQTFCQAVLERKDELLALEVADSGNPVTQMRNEIAAAISDIDYMIGLGYEVRGETIPATSRHLHMTVREPYGIVGRIVPFNHPIKLAIASIGAPLVAGNSVIIKPSEHTSLSAGLLGEIIAETLPPGLVSIVTGDAEAGQALARHPEVRRLTLTGSVQAGMSVQRAASEGAVKNVTLELGGKNPLIAFPDADVDRVAEAAVASMNFAWQGQSCSSASRIFLHDDIYDEVVERIARRVSAIRVGDPFDPATQMGALNSRTHHEKVQSYVEAALADGATLKAGGKRPSGAGFERGYWIEPTVFADVDQGMRIAREEVFGPVMSVLRWSDVDDVIAQANSLEYGLTGMIWTGDLNQALRTAKQLRAGHVWINSRNQIWRGMPYGGVKNSGVGRDKGLEELSSYTEEKAINIVFDPAA